MQEHVDSWREYTLTEVKAEDEGLKKTLDFLKKSEPSDFSHFDYMFGEGKWRTHYPFVPKHSQELNPLAYSYDPTDTGIPTSIFRAAQALQALFGWEITNLYSKKANRSFVKPHPKTGEELKIKQEQKLGKVIIRCLDIIEKAKAGNWEAIASDEKIIMRKKLGKRYEEMFMDWVPNAEASLRTTARWLASPDAETMGQAYEVIVSRHPIDVLRMADFKALQSCHSAWNPDLGRPGAYYHCAVDEAQAAGLVVYLVKKSDLDKIGERLQADEVFWDPDRETGIKGMIPLSRVRIREFRHHDNGLSIAAPESTKYGPAPEGFVESIATWLHEQQDSHLEGANLKGSVYDFEMQGGSYSDSEPHHMLSNFFHPNLSTGHRFSKLAKELEAEANETMKNVILNIITTRTKFYMRVGFNFYIEESKNVKFRIQEGHDAQMFLDSMNKDRQIAPAVDRVKLKVLADWNFDSDLTVRESYVESRDGEPNLLRFICATLMDDEDREGSYTSEGLRDWVKKIKALDARVNQELINKTFTSALVELSPELFEDTRNVNDLTFAEFFTPSRFRSLFGNEASHMGPPGQPRGRTFMHRDEIWHASNMIDADYIRMGGDKFIEFIHDGVKRKEVLKLLVEHMMGPKSEGEPRVGREAFIQKLRSQFMFRDLILEILFGYEPAVAEYNRIGRVSIRPIQPAYKALKRFIGKEVGIERFSRGVFKEFEVEGSSVSIYWKMIWDIGTNGRRPLGSLNIGENKQLFNEIMTVLTYVVEDRNVAAMQKEMTKFVQESLKKLLEPLTAEQIVELMFKYRI